MNRFNFGLDSIHRPNHIPVVSIQGTTTPAACIDSNRRWAVFRKPTPGDSKMESLILASYVLKSNQQKPGVHPALDEQAYQSARSALSSLAASLVGIAAFAFVLTLLG